MRALIMKEAGSSRKWRAIPQGKLSLSLLLLWVFFVPMNTESKYYNMIRVTPERWTRLAFN